MRTVPSGYKADAADSPLITPASLEADLARLRERSAADPFSNPIVLFAIDFARRIDRGEVDIEVLDRLVRALTVDSFANRAKRLGTYLGETDPEMNRAAIAARIERLADNVDFDAFRAMVERPIFGIVLTAHPTFSTPLSIARSLSELACGTAYNGEALDEAARANRLAEAQDQYHRPPENLTLEDEHAWSLEALGHVHTAIEEVNRVVFRVARAKWPERWTELLPHLITAASWVGYDQDGRTDVTSMRTFGVRLADKRAALARYLAEVVHVADGAPPAVVASLGSVVTIIDKALATVGRQIAALAAAERDPGKMAEFSRAMVEGCGEALVDVGGFANRSMPL
jgi:phosphoenolpyruvate carboxylase